MRRLTRSLFGRLVLIFIATLVGVVAVMVVAFGIAADRDDRPDILSNRLAGFIIDQLGTPPHTADLDRLAAALGTGMVVLGPEGWAWRSGSDLPSDDTLHQTADRMTDGDLTFRHFGRHPLLFRRQGDWTYVVAYRPRAEGPRALAGLLAGLLGLAGVAYGNYRAVRWLFAPIRQVRDGAERIGAGALDTRVETRRRDELGDLAEALNRMAERLQGTLEAKRQLLLAISHEVRTPLTKATLLCEMMEPEDKRRRLSAVLAEINRLIGALLDAEAVADRHQALRLDDTDPAAVIREAIETVPPEILHLDVPDLGRTAHLDRLRIVLALRNLLSNAVRHGGESGPVDVTLRADTDTLTISVRDHGPGIAPEHLARLGEPFYRPDPARQRQTGGHGLGLYLTRQIAESHGGRLEIDSTPGVGTTARLTLPWAADRA